MIYLKSTFDFKDLMLNISDDVLKASSKNLDDFLTVLLIYFHNCTSPIPIKLFEKRPRLSIAVSLFDHFVTFLMS